MHATPPAVAGDGGLFLTAELAQRLDLAEHLLEFGPRAVVVTGPAGSGRSTFLHALLGRSPEHWLVAEVDAASAPDPHALQARVAEAWALAPEQGPSPEGLAALRAAGTLPVVAVDDVDALPATTLATLGEWVAEGSGGAVRLVATADTASVDRLQQVLGEYLHVIELTPFTAAQAEEFVHRLLARADAPDPPGDDRSWLAGLHQRSAGRPGPLVDALVEELARRTGGSAPGGSVLRRGPTALMALAAVALVLTGGLALWLWPEPEPMETATTVALAPPPVAPPAAEPPAAEPPAAEPPAAEPPGAEPPAAEPPAGEPPPPAAPAPKPAAAGPAAAPPPASPAASAPPPPGLAGIAGPDWIAARDPEHLTWQLLVSGDAAALERFVRAHPGLRDQLAWYPLERQGRRLLALVWGNYPDRPRALAARRRLPATVARLGPWLRRFGAIQERLRAHAGARGPG